MIMKEPFQKIMKDAKGNPSLYDPVVAFKKKPTDVIDSQCYERRTMIQTWKSYHQFVKAKIQLRLRFSGNVRAHYGKLKRTLLPESQQNLFTVLSYKEMNSMGITFCMIYYAPSP